MHLLFITFRFTLQWPFLEPHKLAGSDLITPNWIPWVSHHRIKQYNWNPGQKVPLWPQTLGGLPMSCGHHVMIAQPCTTHATSLAGHLASGPGTWGSNPLFLLFYFYLIACWYLFDFSTVPITHTCSRSWPEGRLYALYCIVTTMGGYGWKIETQLGTI